MELTYKIELTNKNAIGSGSIFMPTTDFRLELDNGTKIASSSASVASSAEETKSSEEAKFEIPVGAKPKNLILFYDETRVTVALQMK